MNFKSTDNVPGRKGAKMIYESDSYYTSSSSVIGMNIIITLVRKILQKQLLVQQIHIVVFTLLLIFFFILWNISVRECSLKLFKQKLNSMDPNLRKYVEYVHYCITNVCTTGD